MNITNLSIFRVICTVCIMSFLSSCNLLKKNDEDDRTPSFLRNTQEQAEDSAADNSNSGAPSGSHAQAADAQAVPNDHDNQASDDTAVQKQTDNSIELPYVGNEYYLSISMKPEPTRRLKEKSHENGKVLESVEEWKQKNGLEDPVWQWNDRKVQLEIIAKEDIDASPEERDAKKENYSSIKNVIRLLDESGQVLKSYDLSNYCPVFDNAIAQTVIQTAAVVGNSLLVQISHRTYSNLNPNTAFILSIDMLQDSITWRSSNLVSNVQRFDIVGNTIITGYGFTDEPDYIYLLDISTGSVGKKMPIKKKISYIYAKDSEVYIKTYDRNFIYTIKQ